MNIKELEIQAVRTRRDIIQMIYKGKTGHTGGSLSSADIMTALYYEVLNVDPADPRKPDRDYFVLSKGHSVEGYLAVLAGRGFFPREELETYSRFGSRLIGHPSNKVPGVEMNTGALGHGLPVAVGMALGLKRQGKANKVYVLMGDGEQAEGSVWEGLMSGANYKLDNLTAILDRNHLQISGNTEDVMALDSISAKYAAFNWKTVRIDGNDMRQIVAALRLPHPGQPMIIIADTIKGKGVREMENKAKWHHGVPDEALYLSAMAQFDEKEKELLNE